MITKKRFIAGAVCPACSEPDKLMMWSVDEVPHRECVACGYADTLNEQGNSVPSELGTRVNQAAPKVVKSSSRSSGFDVSSGGRTSLTSS